MALLGTKGNSSAFGLGLTAAAPEVLGGMVLMTPTSVDKTGTGSTATIGTNGSVEFSSCATLSLNGVFNTDYDNYMIAIRSVSSADLNLDIRLRVAGIDNSTASSYVRQELFASSTSVSGARVSSDKARFFSASSSQRSGSTGFLYGPFLAQPTAGRSVQVFGASGAQIPDEAFTHNQSTSYDGFSLICDTSNASGLVSVYGLVGT